MLGTKAQKWHLIRSCCVEDEDQVPLCSGSCDLMVFVSDALALPWTPAFALNYGPSGWNLSTSISLVEARMRAMRCAQRVNQYLIKAIAAAKCFNTNWETRLGLFLPLEIL